jgi:predicted ATP-grasp superfamily ATP-dependent carboligase
VRLAIVVLRHRGRRARLLLAFDMKPDTAQQTALPHDTAPAVVVGLCAHGLAIARALANERVPVIALEANESLPGFHTRLARVRRVAGVHGRTLLDNLYVLGCELSGGPKPVLFLTNDRMVRDVAEGWSGLASLYRLSWAGCRDQVVRLLDKDNLEARCKEAGLLYPRSAKIDDEVGIRGALARVALPAILKPTRPLSSFKVRVIHAADSLYPFVAGHRGDLPVLLQQWVPGDDRAIFFCALYLDRGTVLARFDGHKLRSRPMGHTTVAEAYPSDDVFAETARFFEGLDMSGPVSLELKQENGRYWVIEPTVGRTDFWLDVCVTNGVNLPHVEYLHQTGQLIGESRQDDRAVWFNTERDPAGLVWFTAQRDTRWRGRRPALLFAHPEDPRPLGAAATRYLRRVPGIVGRRLQRILRAPGTGTDRGGTASHGANATAPAVPPPRPGGRLVATPHEVITALRSRTFAADHGQDIFSTADWYLLLAEQLSATNPRLDLFLATAADPNGRTAALPLMSPPQRRLRARVLRSLANFYTSLYSPVGMPGGAATPGCAEGLAQAITHDPQRWDVVDLHPVDASAAWVSALQVAFDAAGYVTDRYFCFGNWHLPVTHTSAAAYLASRPSRTRHTLERARRRLDRQPDAELRIVTSEGSALDAAIRGYLKIYANSWKKPEPFPTFVPEFIRIAARKGWLRLGIVEIGGEAIAAQVWLVSERKASIFKLAYDERFSRFSAGTVLTAALMERVIDIDRVTEVDYLIGDDPYKQEWMTARRERVALIAFNRRTVRGLASAMTHFGAKAAHDLAGYRKRQLVAAPGLAGTN